MFANLVTFLFEALTSVLPCLPLPFFFFYPDIQEMVQNELKSYHGRYKWRFKLCPFSLCQNTSAGLYATYWHVVPDDKCFVSIGSALLKLNRILSLACLRVQSAFNSHSVFHCFLRVLPPLYLGMIKLQRVDKSCG